MRRVDARHKAAARRSDQPLSFSLKGADRRLVSTDQLRLPSPTNKAVNPIRRPSAGVQNHMNHNDRGTICQNRFIASMKIFLILKINSRLFHGKFLSDDLLRALPRLTRISDEHRPVDNVTLAFHLVCKIPPQKNGFSDHRSVFVYTADSCLVSSKKNFHG